MNDYSNPIGTRVRATTTLGGWDNQECRGRPNGDLAAMNGDEGVVVASFDDAPFPGEEATRVDLVRFDLPAGTVFVPCAEGDHFDVVALADQP